MKKNFPIKTRPMYEISIPRTCRYSLLANGFDAHETIAFYHFGSGILASVFFIVTGGLAIGGARSGNKCLVVATLVMAILSAIMASTLVSMAGISMSMTYIGSEGFISSTFELVIGGVMLIVGIASASLTCRPLCCATTTSGQQSLVHFTPNQAELAAINLPPLPNLPTSLLSSTQVLFVI